MRIRSTLVSIAIAAAAGGILFGSGSSGATADPPPTWAYVWDGPRVHGAWGLEIARSTTTGWRQLTRPTVACRTDPLTGITDCQGDDHDESWSPDGRQLAFARDPRIAGVYVVGATGGRPRRLATTSRTTSEVTETVWAPNGRPIAFIRRGEIDIAQAHGTSLRRRIGGRLQSDSVSWSPDSSSLVC